MTKTASRMGADTEFFAPEHQQPQEWARLTEYLKAEGHDFAPMPPPRQFTGGMGNLNFLVTLDGKEAVLRRPAETRGEQTRLACGDLELDLIARTARRGERRIELLPREFQMLEYLMRRQGRVVTRTMLLEGVWDYRFDPGTNVIDVHISRLRRKIDAEGEPSLIHTVRGSGYKLAATA